MNEDRAKQDAKEDMQVADAMSTIIGLVVAGGGGGGLLLLIMWLLSQIGGK